MACESWNASSVRWTRNAVEAEQSIEMIAVTPMATIRFSLAPFAFGSFDLGFAFRTNVL